MNIKLGLNMGLILASIIINCLTTGRVFKYKLQQMTTDRKLLNRKVMKFYRVLACGVMFHECYS